MPQIVVESTPMIPISGKNEQKEGDGRLDDPVSRIDGDEVFNKPYPIMKAVGPMIFSAGMDYFGLGLLTPLLPFYLAKIGAAPAWIGWITTAQYGGVLIGGLVMGRIADIGGRKIAIQIACAGDVIFFTLSGFMKTAETLLTVRLLAGFFTPLVPSISWVIDSGRGDPIVTSKYMATWAFCMSSAFMLGSIVGGLLGADLWGIAMIISGIMAFLALIVVSRATAPPRSDEGMKPEGIDRIMRAPEYWGLLAMNVVVGVQFTGGIIGTTIILTSQLGASTLELALFFVASSLYHAVINFGLLPKSVKLYGNTFPAMAISLGLTLVCNICMCFDFSYIDFTMACFLLVVCTSILPVIMTAANMISGEYAGRYTKNARGVVLGISRLAFNVGQVLGPLVATLTLTSAAGLADGSNTLFFSLNAGVTSAAFLSWGFLHFRAEGLEVEIKVHSGTTDTNEELTANKESKLAL